MVGKKIISLKKLVSGPELIGNENRKKKMFAGIHEDIKDTHMDQ
jgi:hypothetical protein